MHSETINQNVFSKRINAGPRRTYFIDVKQTKSKDYYLVITENTIVNTSDKPIRQRLMIILRILIYFKVRSTKQSKK